MEEERKKSSSDYSSSASESESERKKLIKIQRTKKSCFKPLISSSANIAMIEALAKRAKADNLLNTPILPPASTKKEGEKSVKSTTEVDPDLTDPAFDFTKKH